MIIFVSVVIKLADIERAIRSNFILAEGKENGGKKLTTNWYYESHNYSTARMVFVEMAIACHFGHKEICTYLEMTIRDFTALRKLYRELYKEGRRLYEAISLGTMEYSKELSQSLDLRVYRKTLLVMNYLNLLHRQRMELF